MTPKSAAVVGGGPAGLSAAEVLAEAGVQVTVYDHMPSIGRKFLMAGRGGLNLTHSEPLPHFLRRYEDAPPLLRAAIEAFPPERLRGWCEDLGQGTFVGSSGRVFPTAMKASPLLRAWLKRLTTRGVRLAPRHRCRGWSEVGGLIFDTPQGVEEVSPDVTIVAAGGAAWPQLGSDGAWAAPLQRDGVVVAEFEASNCGVTVDWSATFRDRFEGEPLKNVVLRFGARTARGDLVVTRQGLEGGALYALGAPLRHAVRDHGRATLQVGLRPDMPIAAIVGRLGTRKSKQSLSTMLRKTLHLPPVAIGLLREAPELARLAAMPNAELAALVNSLPIAVTGTEPLTRAISSSGGLAFSELDPAFMLRRRPGTFVAGEMLDWDAPTGGYLLQACFATGMAAGHGAAAWLARQAEADRFDG